MDVGKSRFPDPYRRRDDLSHATVFLVVLLLLVAIGSVLFFGNAWVFAPPTAIANLGLASNNAVPKLTATPPPGPTFSAPTPMPALAGIPYQPTPQGGATPRPSATNKPAQTPQPSATAKPGQPAQPKPGSTSTPSPAATPTRAASPTALPATTSTVVPIANQVAYVTNTGGDGVYLRHSPRLTDTWVAWPDNTKVTLVGAEANGDGTHWFQVRDPAGHVGWIPAQYLRH